MADHIRSHIVVPKHKVTILVQGKPLRRIAAALSTWRMPVQTIRHRKKSAAVLAGALFLAVAWTVLPTSVEHVSSATMQELGALLTHKDKRIRDAATRRFDDLLPPVSSWIQKEPVPAELTSTIVDHVIPSLIDGSQSDDWEIRETTTSILRTIARVHCLDLDDVNVMVPTLVMLLDDEASGVVIEAADALRWFGADARPALPSLARLVTDYRNYEVLEHTPTVEIADGEEQWSQESSTRPGNPMTWVRIEAVRCLGSIAKSLCESPTVDTSFESDMKLVHTALADAMSDPSEDLRMDTAEALGLIAHSLSQDSVQEASHQIVFERTITQLMELAEDEIDWVRLRAVKGLGAAISGSVQRVAPVLADTARTDSESAVRMAAFRSLEKIRDHISNSPASVTASVKQVDPMPKSESTRQSQLAHQGDVEKPRAARNADGAIREFLRKQR